MFIATSVQEIAEYMNTSPDVELQDQPSEAVGQDEPSQAIQSPDIVEHTEKSDATEEPADDVEQDTASKSMV